MFGGFIPELKIKEITDTLSEWESFKLLLPRSISRAVFPPVMSELEALQTLQKMMLDALRHAPDVAGDGHDTRDSPTKSN